MSKHHAMIYRNLASLNESGVDLRKSLSISTANRKYGKAMEIARDVVNKGGTISEGFAQSPGLFSKLDISIIKAAEHTGNLPLALRLLADEHENRKRIVMEALGRFIYTIFLYHAAVIIGGLAENFLNQGLVFNGYLTKVIIKLSFLYIPLLSIYLIVTRTPNAGPLRYYVDLLACRIPWLSKAVGSIALGRFARVINLAYRSGMPEDRSVELAGSATGNQIIARQFDRCIEAVKQGKQVSDGFGRELPSTFVELWKVGEVAGTMEATTDKLAEIYQEQGQFHLKSFCSTMNLLFYLIMVIYVAYVIVTLALKVLGGAAAM